MIHLTADTVIRLAIKPVDFRKQMDGLIALCERDLSEKPRSGVLFIFINRSKTMIRCLRYEVNGYWLATKRLSRGRYRYWPHADAPVCPVQAERLSRLLRNDLSCQEDNKDR